MNSIAGGWLAVLLLLASRAYAVLPDEQLANPVLEGRARHISQELRCVVCQNQTIDDSDAELAHDLRVILRERLVAGDTDQQAEAFIVKRYGSYVLLKPRFETDTVLLWLGPFLVLGASGLTAAIYLRNRNSIATEEATLSQEERTRLADVVQRSKNT
jgi:cytochrome c-type biogenesis protein CcmH